uniref:Uncharacterized protein n=1 Tax=viral metagenome TaxID=1070528 RepID=A0A6C0KLJ6_9ZZZZ
MQNIKGKNLLKRKPQKMMKIILLKNQIHISRQKQL